MRQFKGALNIGLSGCQVTLEFEVEDDATEEDIEAATLEAALEHCDFWAEEVTGEDT